MYLRARPNFLAQNGVLFLGKLMSMEVLQIGFWMLAEKDVNIVFDCF